MDELGPRSDWSRADRRWSRSGRTDVGLDPVEDSDLTDDVQDVARDGQADSARIASAGSAVSWGLEVRL